MPECCSIHFTGWYCPKCGLPISFADHGGSNPISIGNISTKNVTINQQLVQGDLIQAGGIKSTGRGNEVPESFVLPPPPPLVDEELPLPPPPQDEELPLPPPPQDEELPLPPAPQDGEMSLPPLPEDDELPLPPPPQDEELPLPPAPQDGEMSLPPLPEDDESPLPPPPLPNSDGASELTEGIFNDSQGISPAENTEIITDELGVEWFEENENWFFKNPGQNWELFQD
ncbi:hypothetical protein N9N12_00040 [Candidatus Poseidoniales archaeon]|jgi:hypothetical protein|nr:hypothetical protein [Candidatus Poseidoniales archaeon]